MQNNDVARPEAGTDGLVPIYHPSGLDSRVLPKAVRGWERQGWSTTKPTAPAGADESPDALATEGAEGATTTATEPTAPPAPSAGRAKSEAAPAAKSK